ncbi:MAG: hypothetical protein EON58_01700 [Alphaproteobacteria bacterium]|nr:MAG: hypothetical protein EON58_01700 [Alphaproteobacteria bacterium]
MTERDRLLRSIAAITADYREGELAPPTPDHVDRWIRQFPTEVQQPILTELEHVFGNTYFTKKNVTDFLSDLVTNENITKGDPAKFWRGVKFLNIQQAGNSQREMLEIFEKKLRKHCNLTIAECGTNPHTFLYLDDVLFTGGRIKHDITNWIRNDAPQVANVAIVTIGYHLLGQWFTEKDLKKVIEETGKKITFDWWKCITIEDRKKYNYSSDVLRPTIIPDDEATQAYVNELKQEQILRTPGSTGSNKFFSSEAGRSLLEQEFLKKGAYIRTICPYLTKYQRPLGNAILKTMGFGSMIVTFRNCPNNAPLALWAGNPWYPLFARKTN